MCPNQVTGRKATAALLLPLLESDAPSIVDRPEGDLDNRFVTEGVVPKMREEKRRRQFVLPTRDADIPVLGDAEPILGPTAKGEADKGKASIEPKHMGSIDAQPVRDPIEEILEGGKNAFETRRPKCGFRGCPMNRTELLDLLLGGEDSTVAFKRDDVRNHDLARELVAFLNLEGGVVLLGVEDDGSISGTTRGHLEEWAVELCRTRIAPPVVPILSWVREAGPGRDVLAVRVTVGPDKPYARVHNGRRTYYIRVGSASREASREELERMYQASGRLRYGLKPAPGAGFDTLDLRRLRDYLTRVLGGAAPAEGDRVGWETLLRNLDLMTESAGARVATVDGLLLFGKAPGRYLPQSGVRAICYPGVEPGCATRADEDLRGPLAPLGAADGSIVESGLVDRAWDFVRRNTMPTARLEGMRRIDGWEYPESVVREALVNALVHRDYSIAGTDVMLAIYADRLEILSPGRLPDTVTVEGMKAGMRHARNQTLVNVMRDYGHVEVRGMGVRSRIVPGMRAHNGTEPDLIAEEHRFTVRLWKAPKAA